MQLNKAAILITGAYGGLGTAIVKMSLELSAIDYIIATDIRNEIEDLYYKDPKVIGLKMDVGSEESIKNVHTKLQKMAITIKYLINCAGIAIFHPVSESTEELLDKTLKVNTYGPVLTVSVFLNDLVRNKGRVIQISSVSVKLPTLFQPYPNSKIALEAFSTSIRQELNLLGVDLVLIRPGAINTNLTSGMKSITNPVENSKFDMYFKTFIKMANADVGKMVEPVQIAQLVKKVIEVEKPKQIYSINKNAKITLLTIIPQKWRDLLIGNAVKKNM